MHPPNALFPAQPANSGEPRLSISAWLKDFVPRRRIENGDFQTLLANFLPRRVQLPAAENVVVEVDSATDSRVLCHCNWQPEQVRAARMTLLLLQAWKVRRSRNTCWATRTKPGALDGMSSE